MKNNTFKAAALLVALGFFGMTASSVQAEVKKEELKGDKPTLKISGGASGVYHAYNNKKGDARGEKGYGTAFVMDDSSLSFQASGRMPEGWTGQTFFDWMMTITGNTAETQNVETNRIRLKGRWGTVLLGNYQGVENFMARGAFGVAGGSGGFDGHFKMTTSRPSGLLLTTDLVGATKYSTKISYVTPRFNGFQGGFTFTPNSEHKGAGTLGTPHNRTSTKKPQDAFDLSSWAFGLNYINKLNDDLAVALSATSIIGTTKSPAGNGLRSDNLFTAYQTAPRHNTMSYALGAVVNYQAFDLGIEWINNGKSQQVKNAANVLAAGAANGTPYAGVIGEFNAGQVFSVAGAYNFGHNKVSYSFFKSTRKFNGLNTTGNVHALAYDRAIAPGFSVFAEGVLFDLKANARSAAFQDNLRANSGADSGVSSGLQANDGRTLMLGAITKF